METVDEVSISLQHFSWLDYAVFVIMLIICALIGVYFGFCKGKTSTADYLVGGRTMSVFPISLSLVASYISGITLLGTPTEIYLYGTQYCYSVGGVVLMGVLMTYGYLPVFHDLQLTSSYEYLELRFNKKVRLFGSLLCFISLMNWLPLVIYVPALAFNQVTGVNVHVITPLVCLVCIFYTTVGGLKAVVWTDVIQTFSMFGAMLLVIFKATRDVGGIDIVFERNYQTGRIEPPDWSLDVRQRHTAVNLVFGGCMYWLQSNAVSQTMMQRYLALPSKRDATRAVWYFILGALSLVALCSYSGMLIFATYHNCDPLTTKLAKAKDQLLPLLVMDTLGSMPGLPGLFVAGVFSAALSSMSTGLNSMAAVALEDFYKPLINRNPSELATNILMRSVVVLLGILCVCLVYVVEQLGSVLQLSFSLSAVTTGSSIGVFTMGLFLPWINAMGALIGGIGAMLFMGWLVIGAQSAIARGLIAFEMKPFSVSDCSYSFNTTALRSVERVLDDVTAPFLLYEVSYMWYTLLGAVVAIVTGLLVSIATGPISPASISHSLLSPMIRPFLSRQPSEKKETNHPSEKHGFSMVTKF